MAVAANRDEVDDRPAESPSYYPDGIGDTACPGDSKSASGTSPDPRPSSDRSTAEGEDSPAVLSPRDARAGGTWIGANDAGVVVAITNRWADAGPDGDRSRGLLVADCLNCSGAEHAVRGVERALQHTTYSPFNLVVADRRAAFLVEWDGTVTITGLSPGVHVVVNVGGVVNGRDRFTLPSRRSADAEQQRVNARRLWERVRPEPGTSPDRWLDSAGESLADHELGSCVHGDGFGTRSASLLRVAAGDGPALKRTRYEYADGPPCRTPFEMPTE